MPRVNHQRSPSSTNTVNQTDINEQSTHVQRSPVQRFKNDLNVKPRKFDGTNLEAFKLEFESVAEANSWNESQKLRYLRSSLTGNAVFVLSDVPSHVWTYESLMSALEQRYAIISNPLLYAAHYRTLNNRDENLPTC